MNTVRALIVRAALPPGRYRGPAIFVLLMLAIILGAVVSLIAASTAVAIFNGGELSVGGTLVQLTSTQVGLLAVTGGLVVAPRTLAGLRLLPPSRAVAERGDRAGAGDPGLGRGHAPRQPVRRPSLEALGFPQETGIVEHGHAARRPDRDRARGRAGGADRRGALLPRASSSTRGSGSTAPASRSSARPGSSRSSTAASSSCSRSSSSASAWPCSTDRRAACRPRWPCTPASTPSPSPSSCWIAWESCRSPPDR